MIDIEDNKSMRLVRLAEQDIANMVRNIMGGMNKGVVNEELVNRAVRMTINEVVSECGAMPIGNVPSGGIEEAGNLEPDYDEMAGNNGGFYDNLPPEDEEAINKIIDTCWAQGEEAGASEYKIKSVINQKIKRYLASKRDNMGSSPANSLVGENIEIKPENKGKFNATKKATGKSTEELTHSKNPITKKRAVFAQNVKRWAKK